MLRLRPQENVGRALAWRKDRQTSYPKGKHGLHAPVIVLSIHTRWVHSCTCREAGSQIPPTQAPLCTLHPSRKSHPSSPSSKTAPTASPSAISSTSARPPQATPLAAIATVSPTPNVRVEHRSYVYGIGKPSASLDEKIHRYRMSDVWGDKIRGVAELYIVLKHYIMTPCLLEMGNTYHDQARVSETFASSTMLSPSSGTVAFAVQLTPDSNLVSVTSTSKFLSEGSSVAVRVRPASSSRS